MHFWDSLTEGWYRRINNKKIAMERRLSIARTKLLYIPEQPLKFHLRLGVHTTQGRPHRCSGTPPALERFVLYNRPTQPGSSVGFGGRNTGVSEWNTWVSVCWSNPRAETSNQSTIQSQQGSQDVYIPCSERLNRQQYCRTQVLMISRGWSEL